MEGFTPAERDIRARAAAEDPRTRLFKDLHHVLDIVQAFTAIPRWSLSETSAAFFFAGLEAPEAAQRLADTETVLAYQFGVTFTDRWPVPAGSTRHHIRTAVLRSGLKVELVALAEHIDGPEARQDAAQLAGVAA